MIELEIVLSQKKELVKVNARSDNITSCFITKVANNKINVKYMAS